MEEFLEAIRNGDAKAATTALSKALKDSDVGFTVREESEFDGLVKRSHIVIERRYHGWREASLAEQKARDKRNAETAG